METRSLCCGIDVSFTTLDVCYQNNLGELYHLHVGNNNEGFAKIMEHTGTQYHFVMEAYGSVLYPPGVLPSWQRV